jgi:DNA-binding MarR family transcriptional regulator
MKIEEEIQQGSFQSEQQRLLINIVYTGNQFTLSNNRMLKQFSITTQQFNVLRILRGQKGNPISVKDMHGRMLDSTSNVSRLVDKLLAKELIERIICSNDRRRVELSITKKGLDLLDEIDVLFTGMKQAMKSAITDEEAKIASRILDKFRIINQI